MNATSWVAVTRVRKTQEQFESTIRMIILGAILLVIAIFLIEFVYTYRLCSPIVFEGTLRAAGPFLVSPEHALVMSVDEKSQIQTLNRTQPGLPLKKGAARP